MRFRLPDDERVRWEACWLAEVYLPMHIPALTDALRRLHWDGTGRSPFGTDVLAWLQTTRESVTSHGAWTSVDHTTPRPALPAGVSSVDVRFHAVATSITIATACFALDRGGKEAVEQILRGEARTEVIPLRGGNEIRRVEAVKRLQIQRARDSVHQACSAWLNDALPGAFGAGDPHDYPRADLFLTDQRVPFDASNGGRSWATLLGFDRALDAWEAAPEQVAALRMATPTFREPPSLLTFAARQEDLLAQRGLLGRALHEDELLGVLNDDAMSVFLTRWSLHVLVSEESRRLVALENLARGQERNTGAAVQAIEQTRDEFLPLSRDVRALTGDLAWLTEDAHRFEEDVVDMYAVEGALPRLARAHASSRPRAPSPAGHVGRTWLALGRIGTRFKGLAERVTESISSNAESDSERGIADLHFTALLRSELRQRARLLTAHEQGLSQWLRVDSELRATAANLRLQRTVRRLTVIAALLAAASVAVAVVDAFVLDDRTTVRSTTIIRSASPSPTPAPSAARTPPARRRSSRP